MVGGWIQGVGLIGAVPEGRGQLPYPARQDVGADVVEELVEKARQEQEEAECPPLRREVYEKVQDPGQ